MAIAFDAATNSFSGTSGTSYTFSHTTSGSNRFLVVYAGVPLTDIITGVTYAGVSMTLAQKNQTSGDRWLYLYYLANPASGANNVVISSSGSDALLGSASSYTGVLGGYDNSSTGTGNASSITTTLTTVADNCWTACIVQTLDTVSAGSSTTARAQSGGRGLYDSNAAITPAGSTSLHVTINSSQQFAWCMISFSPTAPAPTAQGAFLYEML